MTEELRQAGLGEYLEDKKLADQTAKNTEFDKNTTTSDQANNGQASPSSRRRKGVPMPPGMTLEIREANISQYWEDRKRYEETAKNTEFNKNVAISDQANNGQASPSSRRRKGVPMPPGMTLEIRQANIRQDWEDRKRYEQTVKNTEFNKNVAVSDQANRSQPSLPSSKRKGVSMPPGMAEEAQQGCNKQYWEDKKLADQTPKNTGFNRHVKWADLSHPI
ncbi:hypothetical protein QBC46DRAFT_288939 [Diplogelasinospora grovesii]|uniref:Uncharacterized protein n=1 Tax=Diplogelasinospora grovesii TaxID=303347 RepID=A0AAN6S3U2_9PEZI|nr:hypothetical protein QBC46DRAFT_288939 [Diplogelasinospora grovesii]